MNLVIVNLVAALTMLACTREWQRDAEAVGQLESGSDAVRGYDFVVTLGKDGSFVRRHRTWMAATTRRTAHRRFEGRTLRLQASLTTA